MEKQYAEKEGTNGIPLATVATTNEYTELKKEKIEMKTADASCQTPRHVAIQVRHDAEGALHNLSYRYVLLYMNTLHEVKCYVMMIVKKFRINLGEMLLSYF